METKLLRLNPDLWINPSCIVTVRYTDPNMPGNPNYANIGKLEVAFSDGSKVSYSDAEADNAFRTLNNSIGLPLG